VTALRTNSLFIKLLSGFLAVIALLLSFNVLSYTFFYRNLHKEITTNSTQNLAHIAERYEKQFQAVQLPLVGLYFHNQLNYWRDTDRALANDAVNQLVKRIRDIRENEMLFLHDIIIQYEHDSFLIHQGGPDRLDSLYAQIYRSDTYDAAFWKEQFRLRYMMRVFPSADFYSSQNSKTGSFIPLVLKSATSDDLYMTALLDADKMFKAFSSMSNAQFHILDESGAAVFRSNPLYGEQPRPERLDWSRDFVKDGNQYLFYRKGDVTGLSYVLVIPNEKIASQISRINLVLLLLLALALVVGIMLSVVVSIRFYTPIQNIIQTIQRESPQSATAASGPIDELHYINENIKQFLQARNEFGRNMRSQQSQLAHLGYIRKLKSIYTRPHEMSLDDQPFYMILFHLTMTRRFRDLLAAEQDKAANYIKEYISISLSETFPESVTLQVEKDQILSLVFTDKDVQEVWRVLDRLRQVFDRDKEYCYLTLAFQPHAQSPERVADAYEQTVEMVKRRKLSAETQIITSLGPEPPYIGFAPSQEQELYDNLQAGQTERVVTLMNRVLQRMDKEGATGEQFLSFAREVVAKTVKLLVAANVEIGAVLDRSSPYQEMKECASVEEYRQMFERFLGDAASRIAAKLDEKDPVVEFVFETIRQRYSEDLSLDMIADRLGFTASYVSRYFKEKTGSNFSDCLNEVRIKKAKEMLGTSNSQVRDIATRVGYVNVTSFIRMFKKVTGMTPSDYRKAGNTAEAGD
jgi:AraC-like DNA-binding protein